MRNTKITIVGCGLIGGSIALALRRRRTAVSVACLDIAEHLPAIREAAVAHEIGTLENVGEHVPQSAFVILATPVQAILETLARIRPHLPAGAIVTDTGSTKKQIMAEAQALVPPGVHFIGGHPMAGSERSGVEAADPLLFSERPYLLCPYPDTPPEALLSLMDLVESLLALPITIDPEEHDRMMAIVSHLPQLIAVALMHAAGTEDATHTMLDTLAGRGFLDMTRLAASEFDVWRGILDTNREAIAASLDRFVKSLSQLRAAVSGGNAALMWEQAAGRRRRMEAGSRARLRKPDLRSVIDRHDKQILAALGQRMRAVRKIGDLKMNQAAPVSDPDRERRMILQRQEWGTSLDLPPGLVDDLFAVILRHSTEIQSAGR